MPAGPSWILAGNMPALRLDAPTPFARRVRRDQTGRKKRSQMEELTVIGKPLPRIDAVRKVTGEAIYGVDVALPGMLQGKILRSPFAHARILNIDTSRAKRLPGVKAVITAKDTPGVPFGLARPKRWPGVSLAVITAFTPGSRLARLVSMLRIRA